MMPYFLKIRRVLENEGRQKGEKGKMSVHETHIMKNIAEGSYVPHPTEVRDR